MNPKQLFMEAVGIDCMTQNLGQLMRHLEDFCGRNNLTWVIRKNGVDKQVIIRNKQWSVSIENEWLPDAIVTAIALSWSNLFAYQMPRVISIEDWKKGKYR